MRRVSRFLALLRERTSCCGKRIIRISADQLERANYDHQNYGQHHGIFGDVLTFFLRPELAK